MKIIVTRKDEAIRYAEVRAEYAGRYSKSDSARVNLKQNRGK